MSRFFSLDVFRLFDYRINMQTNYDAIKSLTCSKVVPMECFEMANLIKEILNIITIKSM